MNIKRIATMGTIFFIASYLAEAQNETAVSDTSYWQNGLKGTLTFTQINLTNWVAGGNNSVALTGYLGLFANYNRNKISWESALDLGYGFIDQTGIGLRKTDDKFSLNSKLGYKISGERWLWSTLIDFKTQFAKGFAFPNDSVPISKFASPAYITISTGIEFKLTKNFYLMLSPLTTKFTIVTDQILADSGAFGVEPAELDPNGLKLKDGQNMRSELGTFLKGYFKKDFVENVNLESKLELFTSYRGNFGNIDVNWENILILKVNNWLSTNLIMQLIYDDDIDLPIFNENDMQIGAGPRLQFRQIFGVGLNITL